MHSLLSVLTVARALARDFPQLPMYSVGTASGLSRSSLGMGRWGERRKGQGLDHRLRAGWEGPKVFKFHSLNSEVSSVFFQQGRDIPSPCFRV